VCPDWNPRAENVTCTARRVRREGVALPLHLLSLIVDILADVAKAAIVLQTRVGHLADEKAVFFVFGTSVGIQHRLRLLINGDAVSPVGHARVVPSRSRGAATVGDSRKLILPAGVAP